MGERELRKSQEPDMNIVGDALFRYYSAMATLVIQLTPEAASELGRLHPVRMAMAVEQVYNGGITDPEMMEELEKAQRLKEIFDRSLNFKGA